MSYRINSEISEGEGEEEEEREAAFYRLEGIGYRVGQGLVERFAKDRGKFGDALDVIKFVCKDLWGLVFRKQVDNLKTNHRVSFLFSVKWGGGLCDGGKGIKMGEGGRGVLDWDRHGDVRRIWTEMCSRKGVGYHRGITGKGGNVKGKFYMGRTC